MKTDQFYSVRTLADKLALTPTTIYRLVDQGKLPALRIGKSIRFRPEAIDAFLTSVQVGPAGLAEEEPTKEGKHERRKSGKGNQGQN